MTLEVRYLNVVDTEGVQNASNVPVSELYATLSNTTLYYGKSVLM
jgi:hypothetical protein